MCRHSLSLPPCPLFCYPPNLLMCHPLQRSFCIAPVCLTSFPPPPPPLPSCDPEYSFLPKSAVAIPPLTAGHFTSPKSLEVLYDPFFKRAQTACFLPNNLTAAPPRRQLSMSCAGRSTPAPHSTRIGKAIRFFAWLSNNVSMFPGLPDFSWVLQH